MTRAGERTNLQYLPESTATQVFDNVEIRHRKLATAGKAFPRDRAAPDMRGSRRPPSLLMANYVLEAGVADATWRRCVNIGYLMEIFK